MAFFRNLNLGQGWAPTSAHLVDTFEAAGAVDVESAVTAFHPDGRGGSSANTLLQELTGVRVTSRGAPTILRLARRLDRPSAR